MNTDPYSSIDPGQGNGHGDGMGDECRLYLVTPPELDLRVFQPQLHMALEAGNVACVQLRLKGVNDDIVLGAAEMLMPVAHRYNADFIINDRPDLAQASGADGVHIGQDDASYEEARNLLGDKAIIGVTCHNSRHLAMVAGEKDADYVAFGAMYPSNTKDSGVRATPELVQWWCGLAIVPCVAIGGLTPENCGPVVEAGAGFLAVSSGVWNHTGGPGAAVRAFNAAISRTRKGEPVQ